MPDTPLFANNAISSLASAISAGAAALTVAAGEGSLFPTPDVYEYFVLTVKDVSTGQREIMHCTGRSGDLLTVDRAQESTTAIGFAAGSEVSMQLTAGILEYLRDN